MCSRQHVAQEGADVRLNVASRVALVVLGVAAVVSGSLIRAGEVSWLGFVLIGVGIVPLLLGWCGSIPINRKRRHGEHMRPEDLQDELRARFGR